MKRLGIVGGIGPESTIEYYRLILAKHREKTGDGSAPPILINSIDLKRMLDLIAADDLPAVTEYLVDEVRRLARAGAELGLIAANTPHIVFDDIRSRSPIPLVSIVEATCDAARALGLKRLALLGTSFTMRGRFYPDVFSGARITLVVPEDEEQDFIHDKYMNELVRGVILSDTRERLLAIVDRVKERERIDGVILAGTELPLILHDVDDRGIPFLDTTRIHVEAVAARAFSS